MKIATLSKISNAAQVALFIPQDQNVCLENVAIQPFSTNISVLCTFSNTIKSSFSSIQNLIGNKMITREITALPNPNIKVNIKQEQPLLFKDVLLYNKTKK